MLLFSSDLLTSVKFITLFQRKFDFLKFLLSLWHHYLHCILFGYFWPAHVWLGTEKTIIDLVRLKLMLTKLLFNLFLKILIALTSMTSWKKHSETAKRGICVKRCAFYSDMKDAKHGDKNFVKALKLEKQSLRVLLKEKLR